MIAKDIRHFLKRFETTLKILAREGRHVELDARLNDFQKLLGAWLDVAPPGEAPPERMRLFNIIDRFGGPLEIDIHDIAEAATLSGDTNTVVSLANHLLQSAFACLNRQQPLLMENFFNLLVYYYYQCLSTEKLADAIGSRLDSGLHSLLIMMRSHHGDGFKNNSSDDKRHQPLLDTILRFALALIHAAIRYNHTRYPLYYVERIFEHRKHHFRRGDYVIGNNSQYETETIFDYIAIVLVGWSLHVLQEHAVENSDIAKGIVNAAKQQLPSMPVIVAQWELLCGSSDPENTIDGRLGIINWDIRDWYRKARVGVVETRSGRNDWVRLGLRASLLLSEKHYYGDLSKLFTNVPDRFVWDPAKERESIEHLAADKWLSIPEEKRQSNVDEIMAIINDRARGGTIEYLRYVLESPLSKARISKFKNNAMKNYRTGCPWYEALCSIGIDQQAELCPLPTIIGQWLPREYLLDDNNWVSGFGEQLGHDVSRREAISLFYLIETTATNVGELDALARLPEVIRDARRIMNDDGFDPNIIVLPSEDRFAGALFRKPIWQVEGRTEFSEASIGLWEGFSVLKFPYTDPESILLIDAENALSESKQEDFESGITIWIDDNPDNDEVREQKRLAAEAIQSIDIPVPDSHLIKVLAYMRAIPRILIANSKAYASIGISNSDGGFALPANSKQYHRPSCEDIEFEDDIKYVLQLPPESTRTPCKKCKPERWNLEARLIDMKDSRESRTE